jgi:hypothetical protein
MKREKAKKRKKRVEKIMKPIKLKMMKTECKTFDR